MVLQGDVNDVRSQFKSNTYRIGLHIGKDLAENNMFEILSSEVKGGEHIYTIKKTNEISNSQLLTSIAAGNEITSFSECLPSMNEIFIRTVMKNEELKIKSDDIHHY